MAILTWSDRYSVGNTTIDLQHRRLFDLINEMHDAMRAGKGNDVLGSVLASLVTYVRTHFAAEERMMEACSYPDLARHKQEHEDLTRKVLDLQQQLQKGRTMMSIEVMNFLKSWLTNHILNCDQKYTAHLGE